METKEKSYLFELYSPATSSSIHSTTTTTTPWNYIELCKPRLSALIALKYHVSLRNSTILRLPSYPSLPLIRHSPLHRKCKYFQYDIRAPFRRDHGPDP